MHTSYDTDRSEKTTANAVRLRCIVEEVFAKAQRYSEAISGIMRVAHVKDVELKPRFRDP